MMRYIKNKKQMTLLLIIVVVGIIIIFKARGNRGDNRDEFVESEVSPDYGDIRISVSTTGSIRPQNRLELKPSINGRIETILVDEGAQVKKGDILVWMSSTERAALLDAAKIEGEEVVRYWQEVYKATPIIAPIDGEVIVRSVEPGQTVTSADPVLVLSDRLIVEATVDETDIGKVKIGNPVVLHLDAYPLEEISGEVDHISHESIVENNVTMYTVEIVPNQMPAFLRSGMNANVDIIIKSRENVLRIPVEAVHEEATNKMLENILQFVFIKENGLGVPIKKKVDLGITDQQYIEVISGIGTNDTVIVRTKKFTLPSSSRKNPFLPSSYRKERNQNTK